MEASSDLSLLKDMTPVIDDNPAQSPAWDQVSLCEASTGKDRNCGSERGNGNIDLKKKKIECNICIRSALSIFIKSEI